MADQAAGKVPRMSAQLGMGSEGRRQRQRVSLILNYASSDTCRWFSLWRTEQCGQRGLGNNDSEKYTAQGASEQKRLAITRPSLVKWKTEEIAQVFNES